MTDVPLVRADNRVVVDTDIISFWQRKDTRWEEYRTALTFRSLLISFQTLAELLRWAAEHDWGSARRAQMEANLQELDVLPYSLALAYEWADVMTSSRRLGRALNAGDAWIAATARLLGVPLATHNRRHFDVVPNLTLITFAP